MTLLDTAPKPHPADPNRPWPGLPPYPGVFAMGRPDDMPVPTSPAPPPPPTPKPGVLRSTAAAWLVSVAACVMLTLGLACLSTVLTGWSPLNFNEWLVAYIALASLVVSRLAPAPKRPSRPVRRATRAAFHSPLLRLATRAGLPSAIYRAT